MPKGQPVSGKSNAWNDISEKRLLLLMISGTSIAKDWDQVAVNMGSTYSVSACKQKYAKLKAAIEKECGQGSTSTSTPRKRAAPTAKATTNGAATNGARKRKGSDDDDEEDSEVEIESPAKRARKEDSVVNGIIKAEEEDPYDVENDDLYDL